MTYTAETGQETAKTKILLETTEMKVLGGIAGKTLLNRETTKNIRRTCRIKEDINCWVLRSNGGRKNSYNCWG